jgi:glutamate synthase domain-containing protein 2
MVICVTFYLYFLYGHQTFSNYDICEDFVVSCILPVNTGACSSSKSELAQEYLRIICRKCQPAESLESIVYTGLFRWKKLAEDQTDKRTTIKKLPEESYREV